jgi:hypothetical protein
VRSLPRHAEGKVFGKLTRKRLTASALPKIPHPDLPACN